ncbi:hypothetical protein BUQ74_05870 [Leptospira weilii serovar Heyan]|nr:hypothetical protein BUQ74_05870 [Leptospira weilii serovar Heyan]
MQVKSLILVGTLEKYQSLTLIIPKAFLICGVSYDAVTERSVVTKKSVLSIYDRKEISLPV